MSERSPNHLAGQTSPYLLQHLYNPVDWYPWGEQALERARREDRPILLSIGYAACHWCHVMERESFENPETARLLNEGFVAIKVDREERPDIDEIYMNAIQLLTGSGGWPLNVFLTPDLRPFTGGTYFPPQARHGLMGFPDLLRRISDVWERERERISASADELTQELHRIARGPETSAGAALTESTRPRAIAEAARRFDPRWGGFGPAPKFPPDGVLGLMLAEHVDPYERGDEDGAARPLAMAERTLQGMARGGIYDHVGGGFARYSVDEKWLVPHFEKMLYNQALLVPLYVDAWRVTGRPLYRRVVEQTLDFVHRELTDAGGGFWSSLDADSEGREGTFYVWTLEEVRRVLGDADAARFRQVYGLSAGGNFEGQNIPNLLHASLSEQAAGAERDEATLEAEMAPLRARLLDHRGRRPRPGTDDKILTSWNGLMISAYARAYAAFGRPQDLEVAERAASFVLRELTDGDRLLVSFRDGQAGLMAYLDDYAFLARGLLDLYEAGYRAAHLDRATRLARVMIERFEDRERGGFFFTADDHEQLLTRNRSLHDGALPSGAGVACEVLLRLSVHRNDPALREAAERCLHAAAPMVERAPSAFGALLAAADRAWRPSVEVALIGTGEEDDLRSLVDAVHARVRPRLVLAVRPEPEASGTSELLRDREPVDNSATAFVCRDYSCRQPVTRASELQAQLDAETSGRPD